MKHKLMQALKTSNVPKFEKMWATIKKTEIEARKK